MPKQGFICDKRKKGKSLVNSQCSNISIFVDRILKTEVLTVWDNDYDKNASVKIYSAIFYKSIFFCAAALLFPLGNMDGAIAGRAAGNNIHL